MPFGRDRHLELCGLFKGSSNNQSEAAFRAGICTCSMCDHKEITAKEEASRGGPNDLVPGANSATGGHDAPSYRNLSDKPGVASRPPLPYGLCRAVTTAYLVA